MLFLVTVIKGTIKTPKIQHDLFWFCVQTYQNYDALNYNSLYRVHLVAVVNKSGFVHPELELGTLPETLARKVLKFS